MDDGNFDSGARARDIANLRIEVNTLTDQIRGSSLPQALMVIRRTVIIAALLLSVSLLTSSAIRVWVARDVCGLRRRVERLEALSPGQGR